MTSLLLVVGAGLAISFLCSVLEAVLLSMTHAYVRVLEERGDRAGILLGRMREHIDEPIAAILTLNTIAHTAGAAVGGAMALRVFGSQWIAAFSAVLTLAILVLSEIVPKTLGATYWKQLATPAAYTLRFMVIAMKPVLIPLAALNRMIMPAGGRGPTVSRAELEVLAAIGRQEGTIDAEEFKVFSNVMNLSEVRAMDVMTPRTSIVAVRQTSSVADAMEQMVDGGHMRVPVYGATLDDIEGILLARDVWKAAREDPTIAVSRVMRTAYFIPETKPAEDLIREMRAARINMAIVIDEFGGTSGLVTLEDLIEEIVGEIHNEHEVTTPSFIGGEGRTLISGQTPVWQVNEHLALDLSEEEHGTIGGYVFGALGRIPQQGDEVPVEGGHFEVISMSGRRVERIAYVPGTD
jgi:CBS domain containing-hemolysin-like protein